MSQYILQSLNTKTNAVAKKALLASGKSSVKAQFGLQYQVVDAETGRAPRKQVLKKKGKDLIIEVDGEQVGVIRSFYEDSTNKEAPTYRINEFCAEDGKSIEDSKSEDRYSTVVGGTAEGSAHASGDGVVYHEDASLCLVPYVDPNTAGLAAGEGLSTAQMVGLGLGALLVGGGATAIAVSGGNSGGGSSSTPAPAAPQLTNADDNVAGGIVGSLSSGDLTNDNRPTLTFTAQAGSTVKVYDGATLLGTAVEGPAGIFTLTPAVDLADGLHSFTATATNAGGTSAPTTPFTLNIDVTAPSAPDATIPEANNGVNATEASNGVQINVDLPNDAVVGDVVTSIVNGPNGATITLTHTLTGADIAAGSVELTVPFSTINPTGNLFLDGPWTSDTTITDLAGNVSPNDNDTFTLAANAPVISINNITLDNVISASEALGAIPVSGTTSAEPGQTVTVTFNGQTFTTTVQPDGTWSLNVPSNAIPADGARTVTADVSSVSGTPAVQASHPFVVDKTAPVITITSLAGDAITTSVLNGVFDATERGPLNDSTVDALPVISGTTDAEVGQTVTITLNGHVYTTTVVAGASNQPNTWSYTLSNADALNLNHGSTYNVKAVVSDAAGNLATADTDNNLVVNIAPPDTPTVVEQYTGNHTPTIVGRAMKQVGVDSNNAPIYANLAAGDVLDVTVNGVNYSLTIGQTSAPAGLTYNSGNWSLVPQTIPNGNYEVNVSVSAGGVVKSDISSTELHINDVPPTITIGAISQGTINLAESTQALPVTGTTDAPVGSTVTVTIGGQSYTALVQAGSTPGTNTFTAMVPGNDVAALADGTQTATASVVNQYGVTGVDTETVLVDKTPPAAPVADVAALSDTGVSNTDNITADNTPEIEGTGTPGDTITVVMNATGELLTAVVAPNGTWSVTPTQALPEGAQSASVTATDPAGNASNPTNVLITIDTTAPAAPAADVAAASDTGTSNTDNITADNTPTIAGTAATPGDTITVTFPTGEVLTAVVAQNGTWSVTPTQALPDGTQNVSVTATDPAGNTSPATQVPVTIDTTPPAAPVADVAAASDTGVSNTDNITSDTTPTISGTGTDGDTITVTFPTGEVLTAVVSNGVWSVTPTQALPNGTQNVSVTATDPAGNTSPATQVPVTIDTAAPAAPAAILNPGSDTGTSNDSITSDNTPTISGSGATPGDTITLYAPDGTTVLGTAIVAPDGTWDITPSTPLADAAYTGNNALQVTATDPAGNVSVPATVDVTIDTAAPTITITSIAGNNVNANNPNGTMDAAEHGALSSTQSTWPVIAGTTDAEVGQTVTVTLNGKSYTAVVQNGGTWSVAVDNTDAALLQHGSTYPITVTVEDLAGNVSNLTGNGLTVDIAAPDVPTVVTQQTASHTPTITGEAQKLVPNSTPSSYLPLANGDTLTVTLTDGTTTQTYNLTVGDPASNALSYDASTGTWSLSPSSALGNGTWQVNVSATASGVTNNDISTGELVINDAAPLITLDPISGGTINAAESNQPLPITGTTDAQVGSTVTVVIGGQTYTALVQAGSGNNPNTFSVLVPGAVVDALAEGTATATASVTNQFGVTGTDTETVLVDTIAPAAPAADVAAASDTGVSNTDNITSDTTPTITGTGTNGDTITVTMPTGEVLTAVVANGVWSVSPTQPLLDGTQNVSVTATDPAGNTSPATQVPVTIDTSAPAAPAGALDSISDSGVQGDSITNDTTPTISGTGTPGDTITLYAPNGTTPIGTAVVAPNGTWAITPTTPLADGLQSLSITATDPAGNESAQTPVPVTIDTAAPAAPVADVATASDTGTSNTDNITSDNTPTISGTGTNGDTITVTMPTGEVLTAVVANGVWSVTPTQALPDGTQNVSVTATDPAGNTSPATTVALTIDTTAPAAPTAILDPASDSGVQGDNITNDTTPTISGTGGTPGDIITLYAPDGTTVLATGTVQPDGTWAVTPSTPLANGLQNLSVTATDPAGNVSPHSAVPVTIDNVAPTTTGNNPAVTAALDPASDTGVAGDGITSDTTPTLSGNGTPGDTISVTLPTGETLTAVVGPNGTWSATPTQPLSQGPNNVTITATDPAGNTSAPITVPVNVDSSAPNAPAAALDPASDSGVQGDSITNDNTPEISGSGATPGDIITLYAPDGVTPLGSAVVDNQGQWSITPNAPLADGLQSLSVTATDPAGNESTATPVPVTIDTSVPAAPAADVAAASDTGASNTDNITSDSTPDITGTGATPGDTITLYAPNGTTVLGTAIVAPDGTWSITPNASLAEGPQSLSITATDPAGNTSPATPVPVTIDTAAPVVPTVTPTTSNSLTPVISGGATLAAGEILTVIVNGATYTVDPANPATGITFANGNWSIDTATAVPTSGTLAAFADATTYSVTATATDLAGNSSTDTSTSELRINTSLPGVMLPEGPVVNAAEAANGTPIVIDLPPGAIAGDTITTVVAGPNNTSITFTTVLQPSDITAGTITETIPSGDLISANDGAWTTTTDINGGTPVTSGFTLDATAPTAPAVAITEGPLVNAAEAASLGGTPVVTTLPVGVVAGDTVTTVVTSPNGTITLTTVLTAADITAGSISQVIPTADLAAGGQGSWTTSTTIADAAGNTSTATPGSFTLDTVAPAAPVLTLADDNVAGGIVGALSTGATTNDATPALTFTAEPGSTVKIYDGATLLGTATEDPNNPGTFTYTPNTLADGSHTFTATSTDAAGNTSAPTADFLLIVDTTAPSQPTVTVPEGPALNAGEVASLGGTPIITTLPADAQVGDTVTTVVTPPTGAPFTITTVLTQADITAGSISQLITSAQLTAAGDGNWGTSTTITDPAGNTSQPAAGSFSVDTSAPAASGALTAIAGNDSGTLGDNITNDTTPAISGTTDSNATVSVLVNGQIYNTTADGNGAWSITAATLPDGSYTPVITTTDAAGNTTTANGTPFTVDATAPAAPTVTAQATNDNTPLIGGNVTLGTGETLSVVVNGVTYTTSNGLTIDSNTNTWSLQLPQLADGTYTVAATVTDLAGNATSDATVNELVIDATAPTAPTVTAQTTNDSTPLIGGTVTLGAGETLSVTVNNVTYTTANGLVVSNGTWSLQLPQLADATYSVTATVTDAVGNATSDSTTTELVIDTIAPAVPVVTTQNTSSLAPVVDGTATLATGETLTVSVNGATYTINPSNPGTGITWNNGSWSVNTATATPTSGTLQPFQYNTTYNVTAVTTDAAGNSSVDASTSELVISGTSLTAVLATASDTGSSNSDGITTDTTPTITGTANPGEVIKLYTGPGATGTLLGTAVTDANGNWSITTAALAANTYSFGVTSTSASGVVSQPVAVPVTIDTSAPVVTVTTVFADGVDDNSGTATPPNGTFDAVERGITIDGSANGFTFNSTVSPLPVIVGTATGADGQTLTLNLNGVSYTTTVQTGGAWSVTIPSADAVLLNHGSTYAITASVSDVAGNTGMDTNNGVTINIAPPDVPTVVAQVTTDTTPLITGVANKIVSSNTVPLATGDTLTVVIKDTNGTALQTYNLTIGGTSSPAGLAYNTSTGAWSLQATTLALGTYNVDVSSTAGAFTRTDISSAELKIVVPVSITTIPEGASNSVLNSPEAADGTVVNVSLLNTGAVAGDVIRIMWDGQPVNVVLTAADIAVNTVAVTVPQSVLQTATPNNTNETLSVTAALISGSTTISTSTASSVAVDFRAPTAPTISATTWAATGAGNTSSLTGVPEANYAVDSTTFAGATGTVDSILWNSEFVTNGTVVRVQLPFGTASSTLVPAAAGNTLILNWGQTTVVSYTLLAADITAKYVDITVPASAIYAGGYGNVAVTAQIVNSVGNGSALATQMVDVAFDLPLALPASTTNPTYGFAINGAGALATSIAINNTRDATGGGVTNMGDLNGDGFDDFAISDSGNSNIYVVFGQSGNQTINLSSISAGNGGGYLIDVSNGLGYGPYWNVASSDFNGDGLNDLIVGLTMVGNDARTDSAYVIYGKSTTTAIALSTINNGTTPALGFKINDANIPGVGTTTYSSLGSRLAANGLLNGGGGGPNNIGITSAGDVNGDGYEDFIFGEPSVLTTGLGATEPGRAFVLFGTSAGYTNTLLPIMSSNPTSMTNGFFINGNTTVGLQLGMSVGGGGDVNGDGLDDLVVSSVASSSKSASVFVVYGKNNGTTLNISSLTASGSTDGFQIINAAQTISTSGVTLATPDNLATAQMIGDVNGDGLSDVSVTMYDRTVIVFGKGSSTTVDAAAIAAGTSTDGFVIQGNSAKTGAFGFVVNAGDMNGDGLDDMVLSTTSNHAYLIFGQTASGITINLTAPNMTKFIPIADETNSLGQASISNVGDINGDGFDDIMIGISLADPPAGTNFGKTYVVYGGFSDITSAVFQSGDVIGDSGDNNIVGTSSDNQLVGGAGNDTITSNGGWDVMYGGSGNDTFVLNDYLPISSTLHGAYFDRIDGGTGFDTIKLDGAGLTLSLSGTRNDVISQVENIDLGTGGNTVIMWSRDVWDMGDNNIFNVNTGATDVRKQLMITGDATDFVVLTDLNGWTNTGTTFTYTNGHSYDVWNNNTKALQLLIDHAIQQSNITAV